jgi:hypothetical protein
MSSLALKIKDCKCGSGVILTLQSIETLKWYIKCPYCRNRTPDCKTKKNAILAWNGMNRKPKPTTEGGTDEL